MQSAFQSSKQSTYAALAATVTLSLLSATVLAQPGQYAIDARADERSYYFEQAGMDMTYCVFVSSKVDPDTPAPLIIGLHGAGTGPQIMCNSTIVNQAEAGGYIVAAPMGYNERGGYGAPRRAGRQADTDEPENISELSEMDVMNVLNMMLEEFNIDEDRIYLTGHSMGGGGTMHLGPKYAETWAAIAPIAGGGGRPNQTELLQQLKDAGVAVIVVHGDADEIVPVQGSRDLAAELKAMEIESEYVELAGVGHGPVINIGQEFIFEFFEQHSR